MITVNQFRLLMNGMNGSVEVAFKVDGKLIELDKSTKVSTGTNGKLIIDFDSSFTEKIEEVKEIEPTKEEVEEKLDAENVLPLTDVRSIRLGRKVEEKIIQKEI